MKTCSLIITLDRGAKLFPLIHEALKIQTEKDFEVIVAGDVSEEELDAVISSSPLSITYLKCDSGTAKSVLLNKSIEQAKSDYLIFFDGDCIPHKKFVAEHLRFACYGMVVAGRKVVLPEEIAEGVDAQLIASGRLYKYLLPKLLKAGVKGKACNAGEALRLTNGFLRHFFLDDCWSGLCGCNFSMFREDALEINGFDERFEGKTQKMFADFEMRLIREGMYCKVERYIMTLYCVEQKGGDAETESNDAKVLEENNRNEISWTCHGVVKGERPEQEDEE